MINLSNHICKQFLVTCTVRIFSTPSQVTETKISTIVGVKRCLVRPFRVYTMIPLECSVIFILFSMTTAVPANSNSYVSNSRAYGPHIGFIAPTGCLNSHGACSSVTQQWSPTSHRRAWIRTKSARRVTLMGFGGGATDRYSWEESDTELNIKARLPAWAKGKSVFMDLSQKQIKLVLKEEIDKPIIEGDLRGAVMLDGCYWTMESLDDGGKMLYLTLEKAPEVKGSGPWMGVVQGEVLMDSDYPEDEKGERFGEMRQEDGQGGDDDMGARAPNHDETVDEDGFCRGPLTVQGMDDVLVARQVPANGNALFSAVSASEEFISSGQHPSVAPEVIGRKAKELRKKVVDYLTFLYNEGKNIYTEGKVMSSRELVETQARTSGMVNGHELLEAMRDYTMPAGGAEVVALTHVLERPIHIFELASTGRREAIARIHGETELQAADTLKPGQVDDGTYHMLEERVYLKWEPS